MGRPIETALAEYAPITLQDLNGKAAMLERKDNKYVVSLEELSLALDLLRDGFDVLEIAGRRSFVYCTRYFDDDELSAYFDHQRGRRKRCKIRIRDYVDSSLRYLEVKLKDARDATVKKRLRLDPAGLASASVHLDFVDDCHREIYGMDYARQLRPVLGMSYKRITLVAKEGGERMTIDSNLAFTAKNVVCLAPAGVAVLESKSARGNGRADKALRELHVHPIKACSKYCVGMAATRQVGRFNRFLPALKKLGLGEEIASHAA